MSSSKCVSNKCKYPASRSLFWFPVSPEKPCMCTNLVYQHPLLHPFLCIVSSKRGMEATFPVKHWRWPYSVHSCLKWRPGPLKPNNFLTWFACVQCWLAQSETACQADTLPSLGTKKLHQCLFQILTDFCHTGYTQVELTNPCLEISHPSLTKTS